MPKELTKSDGIDFLKVLNKPPILLPTSYLAPISYYAVIKQNPVVYIEKYEHYVKQSIRNRCEIYGSNGKIKLTIPKNNTNSSKTRIKDIKISNSENWQIQHWRSIKAAYSSAPYFEHYSEIFFDFYQKKQNKIFKCNEFIFRKILQLLSINVEIKYTKKYEKNFLTKDYRDELFNQKIPEYDQVFENKFGFISNLSIIDLLFNLGPESSEYLDGVYV